MKLKPTLTYNHEKWLRHKNLPQYMSVLGHVINTDFQVAFYFTSHLFSHPKQKNYQDLNQQFVKF